MSTRWKAWALGRLVVGGLAVSPQYLRWPPELQDEPPSAAISDASLACTALSTLNTTQDRRRAAHERLRRGVERPDYEAKKKKKKIIARPWPAPTRPVLSPRTKEGEPPYGEPCCARGRCPGRHAGAVCVRQPSPSFGAELSAAKTCPNCPPRRLPDGVLKTSVFQSNATYGNKSLLYNHPHARDSDSFIARSLLLRRSKPRPRARPHASGY